MQRPRCLATAVLRGDRQGRVLRLERFQNFTSDLALEKGKQRGVDGLCGLQVAN